MTKISRGVCSKNFRPGGYTKIPPLPSPVTVAWLLPGVGNEFFSRGVQGGGYDPRAQGGNQGGGFLDPKIDQFCPKFKNKPNLGLNHTKLS